MIMYELWLTCVLSELDREIDFEFVIPKLFDTKEAAEEAQNDFYIIPRILDNGEVVFDIFGKNLLLTDEEETDLLVDTVRWTDYKKYHCIIMKKEGASTTFGDLFPEEEWAEDSGVANILCASEKDYLPCAKKFEDLYQRYLTNYKLDELCKQKLHCVTYEVKPIQFQ